MFRKIVKKLNSEEIVREYNNIYGSLFHSKRIEKLFDLISNDLIIEIDEKNCIIAKIDEKTNFDYIQSIVILRYFEIYDEKSNNIIIKNISRIYDFLANGLGAFCNVGIKLKYNINNERLKRLLQEISFLVRDLNLHTILSNTDESFKMIDCKKIKGKNFFVSLLAHLNDIKKNIENKKIESITSMEIPLDFENIFENDEKAKKEHIDNLPDALVKSILELGKVDIEYISKITGFGLKEVILGLKGSIYQNPEKWEEKFYKGWETADEYLSGNLMAKYKLVQKFNEKYKGYFNENVKALEKLISTKEKISDMYISLGSPWIPKTIIITFIKKNFLFSSWYEIKWNQNDNDKFLIKGKRSYNYQIPHELFEKYGFYANNYKNMLVKDGRYDDINPIEIIENLVNHKLTYVEYIGSDKKTYIDDGLTMVIREKEKLLNDKFSEWVKISSMYNQIKDIYNEKFTYYFKRNYNGNFLQFPGMNNDFKLYDYQKNAVARILFSKNTLLAHEVGSGKTFIMIAACMEKRRMGISNKNLIVVPNNITAQWQDMFKKIYPNANIYSINNKEFTNKTKKKILNNIIEKDYDAVIIPYSSFDRIDVKSNKKQNEIDNNEIYFEDLGIDTLFVDEAHNYKNIPIKTTLKKLLGLNIKGSKKCEDMMSKVRCVQEKGGGAVFATGTPITNSISDLYNMQLYLQEKELKIVGIETFDKWRGMFAETTTSFEVDVDTNNYRKVNRLSEYHNLLELSNIISNIIDYHKLNEINDIPEYDGYRDEIIVKNEHISEYLCSISQRADAIRNKKISRTVDNMLKVTIDGRKAALDIRSVMPWVKKYDNKKIKRCVKNVVDIYRQNMINNATQVIFCDMLVKTENVNEKGKEYFSVYKEIHDKLIEEGIPKEKIAYINDYQNEKEKGELYDKFNKGIIRILLGSTFKLGMGVNIQKKLIAIHHFDVPWRPSDMIQREGRILRAGNQNEKVYIYRYITKGTFDAYSWQILETKQKFINQILSSQVDIRKCSEIDGTVLNYAEAKSLALENPIIKEKFEVTNEINKLLIQKREFNENLDNMRLELLKLPDKIEQNNNMIKQLNQDMILYDKYKENLKNINKSNDKIKDNNQSNKDQTNIINEKEKLSNLIIDKIMQNFLSIEEVFVTMYKGFEIYIPTNNNYDEPKLMVKGNGKYYIDVGKDGWKFLKKIDDLLNDFGNRIDELEKYNSKLKIDKKYYEDNIDAKFSKESELEKLNKRLSEIDKALNV